MVHLDNGDFFNLSDDDLGTSAAQFCYYLDVIMTGGVTTRTRLLETEDLVIGRSPYRCQLVLNDSRVSRVHLRVHFDPTHGITVTDLYSAHGSKLDGRMLKAGDSIHWLINQPVSLGRTLLILRYGNIDS